MENVVNQTEPVQVYAEATPNPRVMKLITNRALLPGHLLEVYRNRDQGLSPLGTGFLEFSDLESVMISNSFVSLTRSAQAEWSELLPVLRDYLSHYLKASLPVVAPEWWAGVAESHRLDASASGSMNRDFPGDFQAEGDAAGRDTGIELKIEEILKDYIQPAVEQDGGAIQFKSFDPVSGQVRVVLRGACNGCPSASLTLKAGIENLLRRMVPQVREVVAD